MFFFQVYITEFGSDLSRRDYDHDDPNPSDGGAVNSLRGLDAALNTLRAGGEAVAGLQYWHGWDNGDSYSFWGKHNAAGAAKVLQIEANSAANDGATGGGSGESPLSLVSDSDDTGWAAWKRQHGKSYGTAAEDRARAVRQFRHHFGDRFHVFLKLDATTQVPCGGVSLPSDHACDADWMLIGCLPSDVLTHPPCSGHLGEQQRLR